MMELEGDSSVYTFFKRPDKQLDDLLRIKIPLSIRIQDEDWFEATNGRVPDISLAHYLAARFVLWSLPIHPRVKDEVVVDAPNWVRISLNGWNKDVGHFRRFYGLNDIRKREPMMAIAGSAINGYLNYDNLPEKLEKLAIIIFNMTVDFGHLETIEKMQIYT